MGLGVVRCCACRSVVPPDVLAAVGDVCPNCQRPLTRAAKHERAVAQTLEWADEAAVRGRRADALAWPQTVEPVSHQLSGVYERKRETGRRKLKADHPEGSQWFG